MVKRQSDYRHLRRATAICLLLACAGCQKRQPNHLFVTEERNGSEMEHYEEFDRAYYRQRHGGQVDIILAKESIAADDRQDTRQLIHLRTLWRAFPGRTYAHESMINTRISYCLFRGSGGISYDGSGFLHYKPPKDGGKLKGKITGSILRPLREVGEGLRIFEHISVSGRFKAIEDGMRVTRLLRDIERQLGPLPSVEAPPPAS